MKLKPTILLFVLALCSLAQAQDYTFGTSIPLESEPERLLITDGFLYVTLPSQHQFVKIDLTDNTIVASYGQKNTSGKTDLLLNTPRDISVDNDGNLYVADKNNERIICYTPEGVYVDEIDLGTKTPEGVTVGPDGKLYICYSGDGNGVLVINDGVIENDLTTLSSDKFRNPLKVRFDLQGEMYISDRNSGVIVVSSFSESTIQVSNIIKKQDGTNVLVKNQDLGFTSQSAMLVSSNQDDEDKGLYQGIYRFDANGLFVDRIGQTGAGTDDDAFSAPSGIAIDSNDDLYVADADNNRIQVWRASDNQAPEIANEKVSQVSADAFDFSCEMNEIATFKAVVKPSSEAAPLIANLFDDRESGVISIPYTVANSSLEYTFTGLEADQEYTLYYLAVDASANVTELMSIDNILPLVKVNYFTASSKQEQSITMNFNATATGTVHYAYAEYQEGITAFETIDDVRAAGHSFAYTDALGDLSFDIDALSANIAYEFAAFVENSTDTSLIRSGVFSTYTDLDLMRGRYTDWCVGGDDIDYDNVLIQARCAAIRSEGLLALNNLYLYDVDNSEGGYDLVDDSDDIDHIRTLVSSTLLPLVMMYQTNDPSNEYYQDEILRDDILSLFTYMEARGFVTGSNSIFKGGGVYLGLTSYFYASMLMRDELQMAGQLDQVADNMLWWSRWELIGEVNDVWSDTDKAALKQADLVRTFYNNHLMTLLTLPDAVLDREDQMTLLAKVYNEACQISEGWGGFIKPDYTGYHHHGIWGSAYITGALFVASQMNAIVRETPYAFSAESTENLTQALLAYRYYCNTFDNPKSICGRFPTTEGGLLLQTPAFAYLSLSSDNDELDQAFARLWQASPTLLEDELATNIYNEITFRGTLGGLQTAIDLASTMPTVESLSGNRVFPYGNMQIQRRDDWMVSVKGFSKYVWDYENNGEQNWFGRNQSAGALEIFAQQEDGVVSAAANGWEEDGYDWDHVAGVTAFDLPAWTDHDKSYTWAKFSPEYFVGGVSLNGENGVFAMKYVDVRETERVGRDYKLTANKSYFFFDDQIVCLGSDINSIHESYDVHTTLYQDYIGDAAAAISVNGSEQTGLEYTYSAQDDEALLMTDATGNAYYVSSATGVNISRATQTSRDNRDNNDTEGAFAKAWIDHGTVTDGSYEYMMWVDAPYDSIALVASQPQDFYSVLKQDATAHIVKHQQKKMTGYAIFQANELLGDALLHSTNNDCLLMTKELDNGIHLSVAHPDLGWLDKDESLYQVWSVSDDNRWLASQEQVVQLSLVGEWTADVLPAEVTSIEYNQTDDLTVITVSCIEGKSVDMDLQGEVVSVITSPEVSATFKVYPNPTSGDFTVQSEEPITAVSIIDNQGKVAYSQSSIDQTETLVSTSLPQGLYTVCVQTINNNLCQQLVITAN